MPSWLPNLITVLRIALVPPTLLLARAAQEAAANERDAGAPQGAALALLVAIGASDLVDGHLARRFGRVTRLGAWLDAFADKLAQVALLAFFSLAAAPPFPPVPIWLLALVLLRDVVITVGTLTVRRLSGRVDVVHKAHGKLASALLFALLVGVTAGLPESSVRVAVPALSVLIALSTALYVRDGVVQVRRAEAQDS